MHWFGETRDNYCPAWFDAMEQSFPGRWRAMKGSEPSAVLLKRTPTPERVAVIISGGGSNGPFIPGFVGEGLADAAVVGPPYTAPSAYALYEAGKAIGCEKGVLLLYNNFMGDYLNNDMADELLRLDGYSVAQVLCRDDMGTAIGEPRENRGGRIAIAYLIKIAAKAAAQGKSLDEVASLLHRAEARCSTLSLVVEPGSSFISFGKGISGEPGFQNRENATLTDAAEQTIRLLVEDVKPRQGEKVFLLINRLRLTSYSDSFVMAGLMEVALRRCCPVAQVRVGGYMQVTDTYGYTVTLLCADDEIASYLEGEPICGDGFLL